MATPTTVEFGFGYPNATPPLAGTETVTIRTAGGVFQDATVGDIGAASSSAIVTAVIPVAGVATINLALGDYFTIALTANITSIVFTNPPGAGRGFSKWIVFTQDTTPRTVAWPASLRWAGGVAGVISTGSGAIDVLALTSVNNGTTILATLAKAFA